MRTGRFPTLLVFASPDMSIGQEGPQLNKFDQVSNDSH